jgi:hypothetical protein
MTQLLMTQSTEASGKRQLVDGRFVELDVLGLSFGGIPPSQFEHLRRHVDPDGLSGRANLLSRQEHVQPPAASQVHNDLARLEAGESRGVATGHSHVGVGGHGCQLLGRVAERLGDCPDPFRALDKPLWATEAYSLGPPCESFPTLHYL